MMQPKPPAQCLRHSGCSVNFSHLSTFPGQGEPVTVKECFVKFHESKAIGFSGLKGFGQMQCMFSGE